MKTAEMFVKTSISTIILLSFAIATVVSESPDVPTTEPEKDNSGVQNEDESALNDNEDFIASENTTIQNSTFEVNTTQKLVTCQPNQGISEVEIVNDIKLIQLLVPEVNVTDRQMPGKCVAVLFYSKYCPFSSLAAPHFNALPRAFPDIKMVAINAMMYHVFNTQNGIVGVPSLLLFHNGKVVAKFNESKYTLKLFSKFVAKHTGISAEEKSFVTSADYSGPVTSVPARDSDIFLVISWAFIILCAVYYFTKSKWWLWIVETVQRNWRESEAQAQHEHVD